METDVLIVGAGISGAICARILAEKGKQVIIIDKRNHIAGNCYDSYNDDGILIHNYGPHIFHTNFKEVWDFFSRFTQWRYYQHRVKAYIEGQLVPIPINLQTINELENLNLSSKDVDSFFKGISLDIKNIENSEHVITSQVGTRYFELFFKNYTFKQWGVYPSELSPEVCKRIPVRNNKDDRYFADKYQGMPANGYTKIFEKILAHKNIKIFLQTNFNDIKTITRNLTIYTGRIDEYFEFKFGKLEYRSLEFDFKTFYKEEYQEFPVINYPNDYDFTRITEYKKLTGQLHPFTTVSFEYSKDSGEPYYPFLNKKNIDLYEKYKKEAEKELDTIFIGRLAEYKYKNMDIAALDAINLANRL